jgi:hypothetical protein
MQTGQLHTPMLIFTKKCFAIIEPYKKCPDPYIARACQPLYLCGITVNTNKDLQAGRRFSQAIFTTGGIWATRAYPGSHFLGHLFFQVFEQVLVVGIHIRVAFIPVDKVALARLGDHT